MFAQKSLLSSLALISALCSACAADQELVDQHGLHMTVEENRTTLAMEGVFGWWRNAIDDSSYTGWNTKYEHEDWDVALTDARLALHQEPGVALGATLNLPAEHEIVFDTPPEFGIGWRAVYPLNPGIHFDLDALGIAPERKGVDFSNCKVDDTRVLAALSRYGGTEEELMMMAEESAADQGLPAPENWYDVVSDPIMYEFLFGENKIQTLEYARFAFISVQVNPRCSDVQVTLQAENQLVGPVIR